MAERPQQPPLVDTHCHVDLYPEPEALVRRIEAAQIYTVAVTNAPSVFRQTAALAKGKRYVRPALGLHPQLASERASELPIMWRHLPETRYIGEIGLDYTTTDPTDRATQRRVFEAVLAKCHESADKLLTVHSRRAADDVVDMIGGGFRGTVILHWYSGSQPALKKAVSRGFYFSVNTAMIESKRSLSMLEHVPREQVLTETDGPFVSGSLGPSRPWDVASVVGILAQRWRTSEREVRETVYENFTRLLRNEFERRPGDADRVVPKTVWSLNRE